MFTTVLEDTYDVHLSIVEMLHKRVIKILTGSDYLAYSNLLFFYTKILTLKDLNEFLLFMYSIKNKDIFIASNNPYPTDILMIPFLMFIGLFWQCIMLQLDCGGLCPFI